MHLGVALPVPVATRFPWKRNRSKPHVNRSMRLHSRNGSRYSRRSFLSWHFCCYCRSFIFLWTYSYGAGPYRPTPHSPPLDSTIFAKIGNDLSVKTMRLPTTWLKFARFMKKAGRTTRPSGNGVGRQRFTRPSSTVSVPMPPMPTSICLNRDRQSRFLRIIGSAYSASSPGNDRVGRHRYSAIWLDSIRGCGTRIRRMVRMSRT